MVLFDNIEIQYHFVWKKVLDGTIAFEYCSTDDHVTDIFTKSFPQQFLIAHSSSRGLGNQPGAERGC